MKKQTLLAMALCLTSLSTVQAKNFWLKLDTQHVEARKAQKSISQWLAVPAESTFELIKDYTDHLGFRHQVYQQYVAGVRVEGGIVKVHSRDGVVTSANGHVVERAEMKQAVRRVKADGALTADGRELVLVHTASGACYAYKHFDRFGMADVLTDAETGEELKRLPRRFSADEKTTGQSLYSGQVEFTINPTTDGRYVLNDSARRIYTLDARVASPDVSSYLSPDYELGIDARGYVLDNTRPLTNTDPRWSLLRVDSLVIDSICPLYKVHNLGEPNYNFTTTVLYPNANGKLEEHNQTRSFLTEDSWKADLTEMQVESGQSVCLHLMWRENNKAHTKYEADLLPTATSEGEYPWVLTNSKGKTIARGRYYVSRTAHFAVDVHWGMEQTYDFYKQQFHRDSYDGQGAPIYNVVYPLILTEDMEPEYPLLNFPTENAAAVTIPSFPYMLYGMGGNDIKTVVSLDVLAHEFTHLVTNATSNLEGTGEAGALSESFSDIIGITVKQKAKQLSGNWLIGDELSNRPDFIAIRDMKNPESMQQPSKYQGTYWLDPTKLGNDDGGVHVNCGVQNLWYYYLVEGGEYTDQQGISHSFAGIGLDRAVQIAYRNLSEMLTPTAKYSDAVLGSIQAAEDLYGADSAERQAVVDAWAAVGLLSDGTSGIASATVPTPAASDVIYRLDGTRAGVGSTQGLAPGLYIQNGRKVVVK